MARGTKRPLFDGTTWLFLLFVAALALGVGAGLVAMGDYPSSGTTDEQAAAVRSFMTGATPFWITSGVALVAAFVVDEMVAQFRSCRGDDDHFRRSVRPLSNEVSAGRHRGEHPHQID